MSATLNEIGQMTWRHRSVIDLDNWTREEFLFFLDQSRHMENVMDRPVKKVPALRGKMCVNLFFENSTRTRVSFELAEKMLSADVVNWSVSGSSTAKGETMRDTAWTLESMGADIVVMRHGAVGAAQYLASKLKHGIVLNAGDGTHAHPTQALLDVYTAWKHFGDLEGRKIALVGDVLHSRVARSDVIAFKTMGCEVVLSGPPTLMPREVECLGVTYERDARKAVEGVVGRGRRAHEAREARRSRDAPGPDQPRRRNRLGGCGRTSERDTGAGAFGRRHEDGASLSLRRRCEIMEKFLFKGFKIFNGKEFIKDDCLLVEDGKIAKIGTGLECADAEVVEGNGRLLTPGFIDLHAHFRDPGLEWNEDLKSGAMAGAAGGFTTLVAMPNTKPAVSEPALVEYVLSHGAAAKAARILPAGCVSKKREGKEICEMEKMAEAGAVFFTDDGSPVATSHLLRLALLYTGKRLPRVMEHPEEISLFQGGQVHEGRVSAMSGLKGIPGASEEIDVARGIALVRDTGSRIHFTHISCAGAVELIRNAKRAGLDVTCDTTFHHLTLNENAVIGSGYNSRFKVNPPLRSVEDQRALWEGLVDGTIDAIVTDHAPWHMDEKDEPFQEAPFGIASLECAAAVLLDYRAKNHPEVPLELIFTKMTSAPAALLPEKWQGLGVIAEGASADLTVVDEERTRIVDCQTWKSKARCCPWEGMAFTGWPVMTFVEGRKIWQDDEEL